MNTKRGVHGVFPSINAACFSLGELDTEAGRGGKNRAAALCPSILWPGARRTPTKRERASERVYGANISLAGSLGRSGGQGSAGEGEAACPAVN